MCSHIIPIVYISETFAKCDIVNQTYPSSVIKYSPCLCLFMCVCVYLSGISLVWVCIGVGALPTLRVWEQKYECTCRLCVYVCVCPSVCVCVCGRLGRVNAYALVCVCMPTNCSRVNQLARPRRPSAGPNSSADRLDPILLCWWCRAILIFCSCK